MNRERAAAKMGEWETFLQKHHLPKWEEIPDLGLYMEQVVILLKSYLDYMPPEFKDEQTITPASINNYVRMKLMPGPVKKRYYRMHIAYLIVICSMKQGMSLALIRKILPNPLPEEDVRDLYNQFALRQQRTSELFLSELSRMTHESAAEKGGEGVALLSQDPMDLVETLAFCGAYCRLLAEKMLLLDGDEEPSDKTEETK